MTQSGLIESIPNFTLASAPPLAGRAASAPGAGAPAGNGVTIENQPLQGPPQSSPSSPMNMLLVMGAVLVFMLVISAWTGNKEKKKRAAMLAGIGRNDRVQTIGGVIGTVVEMRDDEIVLRVDDSTNTRIVFARSAVQGVVKKRAESPSEPEVAGAR